MLKRQAAPVSQLFCRWIGKRNRDFYCDAGRPRKRDRNSDGRQRGHFSAGAANANSSATTINGNAAQANSTATGSSGQAQATAQTNFGNFQSVQSTSTSPLLSVTPRTASAIAQAGGVVSPSNPIIPGQSFSVVSGSGFGPLTVANGSMGAGYGGINGISITYKESVSFTQNGGAFVLDLLSSDALGIGFDSALFKISLNDVVINSQSFSDLASAQAFFSNNLIGVPLLAGLNTVQIVFSETMSSAGGFSFDYAVASSGGRRSRPHRRRRTAGPDLGERWSSRLVATEYRGKPVPMQSPTPVQARVPMPPTPRMPRGGTGADFGGLNAGVGGVDGGDATATATTSITTGAASANSNAFGGTAAGHSFVSTEWRYRRHRNIVGDRHRVRQQFRHGFGCRYRR